MTTPDIVTKGNLVEIEVEFRDLDGELVNPSAATIRFHFLDGGVEKTESMDMADIGEGWFAARWSTKLCDGGMVFWHAETTGDDNPAAVEGEFFVKTNPASVASAP